MRDCEYCDYYKAIDRNRAKKTGAKAFCSFAGAMLFAEPEESGRSYLCKEMTYQEYLNRRKSPVSVSRLKAEYWKFAYRSRHPIAEENRLKYVLQAM